MSGALAERAFVTKLEKAGFTGVQVAERRPVPLDEFVSSPLITPDLVELMRAEIPAEMQAEIATAVVFTATIP